MAVILKLKNSMIFSIFSIFISILIVNSAHFFLSESPIQTDHIRARIYIMNSELKYFQNSYLKEIVIYSARNSFEEMTKEMGRDPTYTKNLENYEYFTEELERATINGEIRATQKLPQKNLNFLIREYKEELNRSRIDFKFDIHNITPYETKPFFVTLQIHATIKLGERGCLISGCLWNFSDYFKIDVPIDGLKHPKNISKHNITIKKLDSGFPSESTNWNLDLFEKIISNSTSYVFFEPTFSYSIGTSFLDAITSSKTKGWNNVKNSYNFDGEIRDIITNTINSQQKTYKKSLHEQGVYFNGTQSLVLNNINLAQAKTLEVWFFPINTSSNQALIKGQSITISLNNTQRGTFTLQTNIQGTTHSITDLPFNIWTHLTITENKTHINKKSHNTNTRTFPTTTSLTFGENFEGIIDEFRIYNKSLEQQQILQHYYNYNQKAKGCCSFITLVNPNSNTLTQLPQQRTSHSIRQFFDNSQQNTELFNISDTGGIPLTNKFPEFYVDKCLIEAFSIPEYAHINPITSGIKTCAQLIEEGIY